MRAARWDNGAGFLCPKLRSTTTRWALALGAVRAYNARPVLLDVRPVPQPLSVRASRVAPPTSRPGVAERPSDIPTAQVRLIDADGSMHGVIAKETALEMASDAGLDLVVVQPQADPPVYKIIDYGRWKFEEQKKARGQRQHHTETKEVVFRPTTAAGDIAIKTAAIVRMLGDGHKVLVSVRLRGREVTHMEQVTALMDTIVSGTAAAGSVLAPARLEGRRVTMTLKPA